MSRGLPVGQPDGYFTRKVISTADTRFTGGNVARYGSAELDDLVQRYITTVPFDERMTVLGDMVHIQTDQVTMLPLFFQGAAFVLGARQLQNVRGGQVWNAHRWDLQAGA